MGMGNSPDTIEGGRLCGFYGCLNGHMVSVADAVQAYIQAELGGDLCWINLPLEAYPQWIDGKFTSLSTQEVYSLNNAYERWRTMRNPVTPLLMALYGHPDSVTMWEVKCDDDVKSVGFVALGAEWPSVYFHQELNLLLVIYVDDFKMAGPEANMDKGWALLRTKLNIGPEGPLGMYLGCNQRREQMILDKGILADVVIYDMESFLEQCVARYLEVAPKGTQMREAKTPFLHDEGKHGPSRDPTKVKGTQCVWCAYVTPSSTTDAESKVGGGWCSITTR